jgi:hypothetical protein
MSERIFACITDSIVVNTVVGDDAFADLIRPDYDSVIEVTDMTPRPGVAWLVTPDGLRPVKPYPSWVWDEDRYVAPVPKPTEGGPWTWDEDTLSWVELT